MTSFLINGVELELGKQVTTDEDLQIRSVPRPYTVTFHSGSGAGKRLRDEILMTSSPLLLADQWIFDNYLAKEPGLEKVPRFLVPATEEKKAIQTVLEIVDFLEKNGASKTSMLYVVGGGIIQDLGAFSAYMFKRGIPWTFVPTTLLAQGDSSVGGKTALNHRQTKNLLALFSAPRKIITDTGFLTTLSDEDWLSGGGEVLRLCITGGEQSLKELERGVTSFVRRDLDVTIHLIRVSLTVKRAVVEFDEFELDTRRSMNYGHSFGHALEALTDYRIVHGIGVALGILVENEISYLRGILPKEQRDRILLLTNQIVSDYVWNIFRHASMDGVLDLLKRDKKAEGPVLKLATLSHIGRIDFVDLRLDDTGESEVRKAYASVIQAMTALRNA
jgi:3-dehydroquinate synthase